MGLTVIKAVVPSFVVAAAADETAQDLLEPLISLNQRTLEIMRVQCACRLTASAVRGVHL
jgi:hypothetical protein